MQRTLFAKLFHSLFYGRCTVCLCPTKRQLHLHPFTYICPKCHDIFFTQETLSYINPNMPWGKVLSYGVYKEALQEYITAYKYENKIYFAPFFAECLIYTLASYETSHYDYCIAMPLHTSKLRTRGFNQVLEIAKYIGRYYSITLPKNALECIRKHPSQQTLGLFERLNNAQDIFIANTSVCGKNILLVDDVITTGVTIASATSALLSAGAKNVDCISIAINERGVHEELIELFLQQNI